MDYPGQVNIPGLRRTFEESLYLDDVLLQFGDDDDAAIVLNSAGLDPDEELTSVIIGSSDHPGTAANSLIIGNETADGDIMLAVQSGGNTTMSLLLDASAETLVLHGLDTIAFANAGTISYPNDTAAALTLQSADGSTQMTFSSVNSGHHQADGININTPNVTLTDNANARFRTINGSVVTVTLAGTTQVTLQQNFNSFGAVTLAQTGGAVTMDDAAHLLASVPGANTSVTLTKAVGLRVADAATTAGTVTSAYGIYVDAIASGDTNDYAIYTNAGTVRFGDDVSLDGDLDFTGPQSITTSSGDLTLAPAANAIINPGGAGGTITFNDTSTDHYFFKIGGTFTSGGGSTICSGITYDADLTTHSGDISSATHMHMGADLGASITLAGNTGTAATMFLTEPNIVLGGNAVTTAATLYINNAPTEATNNYALFVDAGTSRFDGLVDLASGQITFPATQSASGDANTLDDYEEGTFTPTIVPASGSGVTTDIQTGNYTKVGSWVHCEGYIQTDSLGTGTGNYKLGGFPFNFPNLGNHYSAGVAGFGGSLALSAAGENVTFYGDLNAATATLQTWNSTGGSSNITHTTWSVGGAIIFAIDYQLV